MKKCIYNFIFFIIYFFPIYGYHRFESHPYQSHTQEVLDYVKGFIVDDPIILEVGAWNGEDTIKFAKMWPKGKIYSLEPVEENFKVLSKNLNPYPNELSIYSNVKIFPFALADKTGGLKFYVSDFQNQGVPGGSSSLLPPKEHLKFDNDVTFNKVVTVKAFTLDEFAKLYHIGDKIDFMWLDMQGFELNMLKASTLVKKTKLIYMEVEFVEAYENQYLYPEIKKWMEDNGFILLALDFDEKVGIEGSKTIKPGNGLPYYGNALFLNRDMIKNVR